MNGKWMPLILTVALVIGLPRLVYGVWVLTKGTETEPTETTVISEVPATTVINVLTNKQIAEMDIEEYLVGVATKTPVNEFKNKLTEEEMLKTMA